MSYTDSRCFIDTNILVYAINKIEKTKSQKARAILKQLAKAGNGIISEQVLLELYNVLVNKLKVERSSARQIINKLMRFEITFSNNNNLSSTIDLAVLNKLSIWDSHIISSALNAKASYLLSEDMQDGQTFQNLTVRNPFK